MNAFKEKLGYKDVFGGYNTPFNMADFDFYTYASKGAAPLGTLFQPMVRSGIGVFYWDFNGDGVIDNSSRMTAWHVYTEEGVYTPGATFVDDAGHSYTSKTTPSITVTGGITKVEHGNAINKGNDDFSTAERLRVGNKLYRVLSSSYNFYRLSVPTGGGLYTIGVAPLNSKSEDGVKVVLQNYYANKTLAMSGGNGNYGYMVVRLSTGDYYIRVESKYSTEYVIFCYPHGDVEGIEPVSTEDKFVLKGQKTVTIVDPTDGFSTTQLIRVNESQTTVSIDVKVHTCDRLIDVYVAGARGKDFVYVNSDGSLSLSPVPFAKAVYNIQETTALTVPKIGDPFRGFTVYLLVLPSGKSIDELNTCDYFINIMRP